MNRFKIDTKILNTSFHFLNSLLLSCNIDATTIQTVEYQARTQDGRASNKTNKPHHNAEMCRINKLCTRASAQIHQTNERIVIQLNQKQGVKT